MTGRVLIVDDHELFSHSLMYALRLEGVDAHYVKFNAGVDIRAALAQHRGDLVLLDLDLGPSVGEARALIPDLLAEGARVVILTGCSDRVRLAECIEAGAVGIVQKDLPVEALLASVRRLADRGAVMTGHEREELLQVLRERRGEQGRRLRPFAHLTPREEQVLSGLMAGRDARQLAADAGVRVGTVRTQIHTLLMKLGVRSSVAAVALAHHAGWSPSAPLEDAG